MYSKLLTSFSVIALLGVSAVSYASWIKYVEGDGKVPNGDCLEMICANGCVENDDFYGYCCPGKGKVGDSCRVGSGEDVNECCGKGLSCAQEGSNKGKCIKTCEGKQEDHPCKKCDETTGKWVADSTANDKSIGECGKCKNGTVKRSSTSAPDCKTCNTTTWKWDPITDYNDKDVDKGCCINGKRKFDTNNCPKGSLCDSVNGPKNCPSYVPDRLKKKCRYPDGNGKCKLCPDGEYWSWGFSTGTEGCRKCPFLPEEQLQKNRQTWPKECTNYCHMEYFTLTSYQLHAQTTDQCSGSNTKCTLCGQFCEGSAEDHPCKKCNNTTGKWDLPDDENTDGLTECYTCSNGKRVHINDVPKYVEGKPVKVTWRIKDCGQCNKDGSISQHKNVTVPPCKKCDTNNESPTRWQFIVNDKNKKGLTPCQKCDQGEIVLKNDDETVECGSKCCKTGYVCKGDSVCCEEASLPGLGKSCSDACGCADNLKCNPSTHLCENASEQNSPRLGESEEDCPNAVDFGAECHEGAANSLLGMGMLFDKAKGVETISLNKTPTEEGTMCYKMEFKYKHPESSKIGQLSIGFNNGGTGGSINLEQANTWYSTTVKIPVRKLRGANTLETPTNYILVVGTGDNKCSGSFDMTEGTVCYRYKWLPESECK